MPCPFCMIASGAPPSPNPAIIRSSSGSAYIVLSTPVVIAFLDIAPLSRGHVLVCPRAHRDKSTEMTVTESAALGFWLPVLTRAVLKAIGSMAKDSSWNIIQANGVEAGQTVPHSHFHIIPRVGGARGASDITDAERKNLALGEGPRTRLDNADGTELSRLIKAELAKEIVALKEGGDIVGGVEEELHVRTMERGLKI